MKALIHECAETLTYRHATNPQPDAGGHLSQVEAVVIGGSDMHAYLDHGDRHTAPSILGLEAAGTIIGGPQDARV